jgi:hypothetical protein
MSVTALFQKAVARAFTWARMPSYARRDIRVYNGTVTRSARWITSYRQCHCQGGHRGRCKSGAFTPSTTGYLTINGTSSLQNGTFDYKYQGTVWPRRQAQFPR